MALGSSESGGLQPEGGGEQNKIKKKKREEKKRKDKKERKENPQHVRGLEPSTSEAVTSMGPQPQTHRKGAGASDIQCWLFTAPTADRQLEDL